MSFARFRTAPLADHILNLSPFALWARLERYRYRRSSLVEVHGVWNAQHKKTVAALRQFNKNPQELRAIYRKWRWLYGEKQRPPFAGRPPESQLAESLQRLGLDTGRNAERSVAFLHNSYYHFYYLAAALRERGWDAISVSAEPANSPNALYYHGEDLNLFDTDAEKFRANLWAFFECVKSRFSMVHFAGDGMMGIFPENRDSTAARTQMPWDFLELKRHGVRIGYTISGCNDGQMQSSVHERTNGLCDKCVWQLHPDVCNDVRSAMWGRKLDAVCDIVAVESDWAVDFRRGDIYYWEPLTMCVDPDVWDPNSEIPDELQIRREPGEIVIYHAVGNYSTRSQGNRNIKGTPAVVAAVERLQRDGINVRLLFVTDRPSAEVRNIQAQADIIVDQLNYGRYGATSREAMALGKPTICYIDKSGEPSLRSLAECPLVTATEDTVYDVLKDLISSPEERERIGRASREFAIKWLSPAACAANYEAMFDRVLSGRSVRPEEGAKRHRHTAWQ